MQEKELGGEEKDFIGRVEGEPFRRGKKPCRCVFDTAVRGGVVDGGVLDRVSARLGKSRRSRHGRAVGCKGQRIRDWEKVEVHLGAKAFGYGDGSEPAGKGNEVF